MTFKKFDMFGAPLPAFNIRGETKVRTYAGCVATLCILWIGLIFALLRLQQLVARDFPSVNTFIERDAYDSSDVISLGSQNFMMAFAVVDYVTGEKRADERFVKWFAEYRVNVDGVLKRSELPMQACKQADLDKLY